MNRKQLESYRNNKRLVEWNRKKIAEEENREIPVVKGMVKGSSHDFPYIPQRFSVEMEEPKEADRVVRKIALMEKEIQKAEHEMDEVENFILGIRKIEIREILFYRYIDGMSIREIGRRMGYSTGRVSQILSDSVSS